jgi:hypothetical protein
MKEVTATGLRNDIFNMLDAVIRTGQPLVVKRKGHRIIIDVEKMKSPTERLFSRSYRKNAVIGDPEDLVDIKAWEWEESE